MRFLLTDLIKKNTAAGVAVGTLRSEVVAKLGDPGMWEGHVAVPAQKSSVWRYGPLQITFDEEQVSSITLFFETLDDATGATRVSCCDLLEERITSLTTIGEFERFLRENDIVFERKSDVTRQQVLQMSGGVVARFSRRTDYERSALEGRPVSSDDQYLISIRVSEKSLANSDA